MHPIKIFIVSFLFLVLTQCGFKVLDKSELKKYKISLIETTGDKKINFLIKNDLMSNIQNNISNEEIVIKINSEKNKAIKEKNINNQITKYEISLNTQVEVIFIKENLNKLMSFNISGDYDVGDNHSTTINNQNNLERLLTSKISAQIINKLSLIVNDF